MLPVFATRQVLNVYNWSGYIPQNVITLFQKETGIKLNYSMFQSNEELYTKLKTDPNSSYDIVVPTSYLVEQMRDEGMLTKLDKRQLPNFKYLNTLLLNKSHDPGNQYSVPYLWGTTGIIVNRTEYPPGTITSWKDLWQPRFKNQIIGSNATRDMFGIAFKALGYSINDTDPQVISVKPGIEEDEISQTNDVEVTFNTFLKSSTVKTNSVSLWPDPYYEFWFAVRKDNTDTETVVHLEHPTLVSTDEGGWDYWPVLTHEIKSTYQICMYPAIGPNSCLDPDTGRRSANAPYCCNGVPSASQSQTDTQDEVDGTLYPVPNDYVLPDNTETEL